MTSKFWKAFCAMFAAVALLQAPTLMNTAMGDYYLEEEEWYDPSDWFNGSDYEWEYEDDDSYYEASYYDDGYADDDWFYDSYGDDYDWYDDGYYDDDYDYDYYEDDYDYAEAYDYDLI
ncbi:hypothetical protein LF1_11830 [Rubripirellula obstinata]|uniref:Uncharacterized protein n=1 Tax=Rubripirellula obstinata TaxID=406547 RepID=A0A5B1CEL4_9BACT|nr:hypothetical protein [Rubripirellula obstinata]KAA1258661.1 hypothetical protein LF1_11830 [Rubripirellula obstinata]